MRPDDSTDPTDDRSTERAEVPCCSEPGARAESFPGDDLVRDETHRLRRLAARLLSNEQDREDLIQEVWLQSVERPPKDRGGARSWLWVVATHAASRLGRRSRSRAARERSVAKPERVRSVLDALEHDAARAELRRWVDGLKDPYREVVRLHYIDGVTLDDIARRLKRPNATVRSQLKRGLDQLRSRYDLARGASVRGDRKRASAWLPWWRPTWISMRESRVRATSGPDIAFRVASVAAGLIGVALGVLFLRADPSVDSRDESSLATTLDTFEPARTAALDLLPSDPALASRTSVAASPAAGAPAQRAGYVVDGRALDIRGEPVANAEVWASPSADDAPGRSIARTDAAGRFRSSPLQEDLWIWAEALDHGLTGRLRVHAPAGADSVTRDLKFAANSGRASGRVLDARGGPIAGAQVRSVLLQSARRSIGWHGEELAMYASAACVTDAEGRFEMSRIQSQRVDVLVTCDASAPFATWFEPSGSAPLALVVPDAASLEVHVRRPDGAPAAGVAVTLEHPAPLPASTGETDARGTYRFERVPPGPFTWIARETRGDEPMSIVRSGELLPGASLVLDPAELSSEWTIRGTAMHGTRPLADWTVSLDDNTDALSPYGYRIVRTSAGGEFAFAGCVGTNYTLRLRPPGHSKGVPHASAASVAPGGPAVRLAFDEWSEPSAFIGGTLADARIEPGHAVTVTAVPAGHPTVDDDAAEAAVDLHTRRFAVGPLPPGSYELHATHSLLGRWKLSDVDVLAGAQVDLGHVSTPRTGTLVLRWSRSSGPIDETFCFVLDGQGVQLYGRRDRPSERFEVDEAARTIRVTGLLAGEYSMLVQGQSIASVLRDVRIVEGEESTVDVALRPGSPVEVRVRAPRLLTSRESVGVRIHSDDGVLEFHVFERPRVLNLDAVARFRSNLAAGSNLIEVFTSCGMRGERTFEVAADEPVGIVTLEIR